MYTKIVEFPPLETERIKFQILTLENMGADGGYIIKAAKTSLERLNFIF
ncbi:hypothetical protein [Neobacillus sp. 114]|nr:hypothetical protein [Neobacillus sp. 114]